MNKWTVLIALLLGCFAIIGYVLGLFGGAKEFPEWDVSRICSGASDPEQCKTLETAAQNSVSGTWELLPENYRSACLKEVVKPEDESFRALAQCLEQQAQKGLGKDGVNTAATTGTPDAGSSTENKKDMTTPERLAALLAERGSWGTGSAPGTVEAPLAAGAEVPLPKSGVVTSQAGPTADTIVHEPVITPPAELTPVPQEQINTQMAALLAERESWGTAPAPPVLSIPEAMTALLAERESWGTGPDPQTVDAPLAAGAVVPLPKSGIVTSQAGPTADTIVHEPVITPPAELTPVPQDQITTAMAELLVERGSWGTEPSTSAVAAKPQSIPEAMTALLAERESWGTGPDPQTVDAPLAAGAVVPLPKSGIVTSQAGPTADTIVHEPVITPPAELTPVPQDQIAKAMSELLAERESWGSEPSASAAAADVAPSSSIPDVLAALLAERESWGTEPSTSAIAAKPQSIPEAMTALLAERESWGTGPAPQTVEAPLAAGAVVPLPGSGVVTSQAGPTADTIVHEPVVTPPAELTPVSQDQIAKAMSELLAERESWGTEPSASTEAAKPQTIPEALTALLAERESWGTGPAPQTVEAPLAAGAVVPLPGSGVVTSQAGPTADTIVHEPVVTPPPQPTAVPQDQIAKAMTELLAERASWGSAPGQQVAAVAPVSKAAASCQDDLRGIARSGVIRFASASAKLRKASHATLDKIAAKMKTCSGVHIRVEGHTDATGSAELNQSISQKRAEAVVGYLTAAGVSAGQLSAKGFGETMPVASNKTRKSRRKNRRIDFTVMVQ